MRFVVLLAALAFQTPLAPPPAGQPASIEGYVVRLDNNEPLADARVVLAQRVGGPAGKSGERSAVTDREGHFLFSEIEPGRYVVTAYCNGFVRGEYGQRTQSQPPFTVSVAAGQQVKDIVFKLLATAVVTGRVYDADNQPLANASVNLMRVVYDADGRRSLLNAETARTDDLGEYRLFWLNPGKYYLSASAGFGTGVPSPNQYMGPDNAFAPTYFPGAVDPSGATPLVLTPGANLSGMDIQMIPAHLYSVRGRVFDENGGVPGRPNVILRTAQAAANGPIAGIVSVSPNGDFEIRNVPPGAYYIAARTGAGPGAGIAQTLVNVNGDIEGVTLTIRPPVSIQGRVDVEGTLPGGVAMLRLFLRPMEPGNSNASMVLSGLTGADAAVDANGRFTLKSVNAGLYRVTVSGLPPDCYVRVAQFRGEDALQNGLAVDGPADAPLQVVIATNAPRIDGMLIDKDGNPVANTMVILMPDDRQKSEAYKTVNSDPTGHFTIQGIIPGSYKLFSWDSLEPGEFRDPDFVAPFENLGQPITLGAGDSQQVQIRVINTTNPGR